LWKAFFLLTQQPKKKGRKMIEVKLCIAKGAGDVLAITVNEGANLGDVLDKAERTLGTIDFSKFEFRVNGDVIGLNSPVRAGDYIVASPTKIDGNR